MTERQKERQGDKTTDSERWVRRRQTVRDKVTGRQTVRDKVTGRQTVRHKLTVR